MQKDDFLNLGNLGNKRTWSRPPRFIHRQILCSNNNKGKQRQNKQTLTRFATLAFFKKMINYIFRIWTHLKGFCAILRPPKISRPTKPIK